MSWTRERARIAAHKRNHPEADVPGHLYRDLRAARLEDHIAKTLASAPPLSDEQMAKLATLFSPRSREGAAA